LGLKANIDVAEKEKSLVPTQTQNPDHSALSLVALPTPSLRP